MKKGLLVVVAALLLVSAPALLFAQGFLPAGLPGGLLGPGFGTPSNSSCDPGKLRFFDPLSFYVGYGDTTPGRVSLSFNGLQLGALNELTHRWDVRGIWLGVSEKANFSENAAVAVEAWWLIPITAEGSEVFTTAVGAFQVPGGASWTARPDWWFLDGRLLATPYPSNFMFFAGFRYDHFSTRFESQSGGLGIFAGNADVTVNSYIPYIGGEFKARASGAGNILIRVLGFPWVPAEIKRSQTVVGGGRLESTGNFTDRGYFFEVFGEYDWKVFGGSSMGAFVRWNVLDGRGSINTDLNPVGASVSDNFSFHRNHITVGGKVALDFALPY